MFHKKDVNRLIYARIALFLIGNIVFSLGITITIKMQHLGIHPWDTLTVGLFNNVGFSIGTWNVVIGIILITVSLILDRTYVKIGTLVNAILIGLFVDFYLWLDFLPTATHTWTDVVIIIIGIITMGIGGGMYNAASIGSGPRDGFMLSISDRTGISIGRVRIITELSILVIGWLIGGPVFIFTFIFTFLQSPIFQFVYLKLFHFMNNMESRVKGDKTEAI